VGESLRKPLIFMHFHGVFLGSLHEIWSKQHNGKVRFDWHTAAPAKYEAECATNGTHKSVALDVPWGPDACADKRLGSL